MTLLATVETTVTTRYAKKITVSATRDRANRQVPDLLPPFWYELPPPPPPSVHSNDL